MGLGGWVLRIFVASDNKRFTNVQPLCLKCNKCVFADNICSHKEISREKQKARKYIVNASGSMHLVQRNIYQMTHSNMLLLCGDKNMSSVELKGCPLQP